MAEEQRVEFAGRIQRGYVVVAAEVLVVDEDLGHAGASTPLAHFELTFEGVMRQVDRCEVDALARE